MTQQVLLCSPALDTKCSVVWLCVPVPCRCLLAKIYNAAAPLVDTDLTEVDPARTAVKATDVLLYCYYGGMVAAGKQGLQMFFDCALTAQHSCMHCRLKSQQHLVCDMQMMQHDCYYDDGGSASSQAGLAFSGAAKTCLLQLRCRCAEPARMLQPCI